MFLFVGIQEEVQVSHDLHTAVIGRWQLVIAGAQPLVVMVVHSESHL